MDQLQGLELSRRFYHECVAPLIHSFRGNLKHSAALIGPGSEVLGFDDHMSTDHHWGPRVMIFLSPDDHREVAAGLSNYLSDHLPYSFHGISTNFAPPDPTDNGVQVLQDISEGPVRHRVEILTISEFLESYTGISSVSDLESSDWLTLPEQKLRSLTSGDVFHDGLDGALSEMRSTLAYYPKDVWVFQMAGAWARIGQEEHLMGRAGIVGDELGSALIGSRLARDIMRLVFFLERTYAPYPKWFGTAFRQLEHGAVLYPVLNRGIHAAGWQEREEALVEAYEYVAELHNRLGLTRQMPTKSHLFFGRPFRVLAVDGFSAELLNTIENRRLTELLRRSPIGGIDQVSDNTDILGDPGFRPALRRLYQSPPAEGDTKPEG